MIGPHFYFIIYGIYWAVGSDGKESACDAGDLGLIPGSGRSPGEGNGKSFCMKNPTNRRALQPTVHGVT